MYYIVLYYIIFYIIFVARDPHAGHIAALISSCVHIYIYIYIYICACVYMCVYIYIYTLVLLLLFHTVILYYCVSATLARPALYIGRGEAIRVESSSRAGVRDPRFGSAGIWPSGIRKLMLFTYMFVSTIIISVIIINVIVIIIISSSSSRS